MTAVAGTVAAPEPRSFRRVRAENRRRVHLLLAVFLVLAGAAGWAAGVGFERMRGTPYGEFEDVPATPPWRDYRYLLAATTLLLGFVQVKRLRRQGDLVLLGLVEAKPLRERQLENVTAEMALAAGLPRPRLWIVEDPTPNAFACGWDERRASVAVTRGLLERMSREELQAVVAHEVAHIRGGDTRLMTLVAGMLRAVRVLAPFALGGPLGALWLAGAAGAERDGGDAPEPPAPAAWEEMRVTPGRLALLLVGAPLAALAVLAASLVVSLTLLAVFMTLLLASPLIALVWALVEVTRDLPRAGLPPEAPDPDARPGRWTLLLFLVPCGLILGPAILLVGLAAPLALLLLRLAIARTQEFRADAGAVELTRNPRALASALRKLRDAAPAERSLPAALAPLCIAPLRAAPEPGADAGDPAADLVRRWRLLWSTHPDLDERIRRVEAMAA